MKDPKAEQMLDAHLVDYVYVEDVDITQVDVEASLRNQARIDPPLYADQVAQYVEAIRDGIDFPAPIGYYDDNQMIILIDGNHRVNSHLKAGTRKLDFYIVDAAPDVIQALTYMANATHGRPPSDEERMHHAVHLRDLGYSNKDAARAVAMQEQKVSVAYQLEMMKRRARRLGVLRQVEAMNREIRYKLGPIENDIVFKALVEFIGASKGLTRLEVGTLIGLVKKASTEATQLQTIKEFADAKRDEQRTEGRSRFRQTARGALLPHLGYIVQQEPEAVANSTLTPEQRQHLKSQLVKTVSFCSALMKLLNAQEPEEDETPDPGTTKATPVKAAAKKKASA